MTNSFPVNWDLDGLYPPPQTTEFQELFSRLKTDLNQLASDSEQLQPPESSQASAVQWAEFLERIADLQSRLEDMHSFVGCHAAADAANKECQRLEGALAALEPLRARVSTNLELALMECDGSRLSEWSTLDHRLRRDLFFMQESRRNVAFRLPKEQELLAADLDVDGRQAWSRLYDRLSGELRVDVMEKGEIVRKSPGQVRMDSPERAVRQNNFFASCRAWDSIADSCAEALNHIAGSRLTRYRHLGVQDHLERPLRLNRMQRQTLETMWNVVNERKPALKAYFNAKAKLLGVDRLAWYDIQAPLVRSPSAAADTISYDDACRTVIRSLGEFSPDFGQFAERALAEGWVEVEDRPGKRQGGFCTGFPTRQQSRIFMTFTNSQDSMSTLAHELGHAYHSFVLRDEPMLLQEYPMNLAETASTFAETVLGEQRLAATDSTEARLTLLDHSLSDAVAFLMNIHARFLFEDRFHHERHAGELSAERLSELMLQAQRDAYCDTLAEDGWYPGFWISKLHFYINSWPFYNFPYTFGYLLSMGLFELRARIPDFSSRYRQFLILTGSREVEAAVAESFGFDLTQPDFWNTSLDVLDHRISQFLAIA